MVLAAVAVIAVVALEDQVVNSGRSPTLTLFPIIIIIPIIVAEGWKSRPEKCKDYIPRTWFWPLRFSD